MCGIYARFLSDEAIEFYAHADTPHGMVTHPLLSHRGPDESKVLSSDAITLAFYRLAIVGRESGQQPFNIGNVTLLCNGEIYNYKQLIADHELRVSTESDCEVIAELYMKYGIEYTVRLLDGEFAFILIDRSKHIVHFARDFIGVKPLYMSCTVSENKVYELELASELKGLKSPESGTQVIPRVIYTYGLKSNTISMQPYHLIEYNPQSDVHRDELYQLLKKSVEKRIVQSERPIGFLLSGGLDSSLVLSIAMESGLLKTKPSVFTFGYDRNAPDVKSAELMVKWLRSKYGEDCIDWHLVIQEISTGLEALYDVIYHLETYDTTTIRAGTPMFLISKYIREKTDVKVVLSGEGSDELFGGYLYFKYAPNETEFRNEILSLLTQLHEYDVLRADRMTAAWGLEVRPPFLDKAFVTRVLQSSELLPGISNTKELLRAMVADRNLLPEEILHGKKEAFSDAVGLSWKTMIANHAKENIEHNSEYLGTVTFSRHIPPETDEMKFFQMIYHHHFGTSYHTLHKLWLPNQLWIQTGLEPSARVLPNYSQHESSDNLEQL